MNKNKGFTLIELLVVIAIIGILSSVVLASLNSARNKGADAAIKNNLSNIRAQAEMHYDDNSNSYATLCTTTTSPVAAMLESARSASGATSVVTAVATAGTSATVVCHSQAGSWAASSPLKTSSANSWCVDSTGASKQITGYLGVNDYDC